MMTARSRNDDLFVGTIYPSLPVGTVSERPYRIVEALLFLYVKAIWVGSLPLATRTPLKSGR